KVLLHGGVRINRLQVKDISGTTLHKEDTAGLRKSVIGERGVEVLQAVQILAYVRVIRHIAKVLRSVVGIRGLFVETFLVPAECHRRLRQFSQKVDIVGNIGKVGGGICVPRGDGLGGAQQHGKRKRRVSQIDRRGVAWIVYGRDRQLVCGSV